MSNLKRGIENRVFELQGSLHHATKSPLQQFTFWMENFFVVQYSQQVMGPASFEITKLSETVPIKVEIAEPLSTIHPSHSISHSDN